MIVSWGYNSKLEDGKKPSDEKTGVFNFSSSKKCVSRKTGKCQLYRIGRILFPEYSFSQLEAWVERNCYGCSGERVFNNSDLHDKQGTYNAMEVAMDIMKRQEKHEVREIRISQDGDFRNQEDVNTLAKLARFFDEIRFFGYTVRTDLKFDNLPSNVVLNVSGESFKVLLPNEEIPKGFKHCGGKCGSCTLCKRKDARVYTEFRAKDRMTKRRIEAL